MFDDIVKSNKKLKESRRINSFPKIQQDQVIVCLQCKSFTITIKNIFPMSRDLAIVTFECMSCGDEFKMIKESNN